MEVGSSANYFLPVRLKFSHPMSHSRKKVFRSEELISEPLNIRFTANIHVNLFSEQCWRPARTLKQNNLCVRGLRLQSDPTFPHAIGPVVLRICIDENNDACVP